MQVLLSRLHSCHANDYYFVSLQLLEVFQIHVGLIKVQTLLSKLHLSHANGYRFLSLYGYTITFSNSSEINQGAGITKRDCIHVMQMVTISYLFMIIGSFSNSRGINQSTCIIKVIENLSNLPNH